MKTEKEMIQLQKEYDEMPFEFKLQTKFLKYKEILEIIDSKTNKDRVASISQKELASLIRVSQTNISFRIDQLIQHGALEKMAPGKYRLLHNDFHHTPYESTLSVYYLFEQRPDLYRDYKKQSEILDISLRQVQQAWAFLMADPKIFFKKPM